MKTGGAKHASRGRVGRGKAALSFQRADTTRSLGARVRGDTPLPCLTMLFLQDGDAVRKDVGHIAL